MFSFFKTKSHKKQCEQILKSLEPVLKKGAKDSVLDQERLISAYKEDLKALDKDFDLFSNNEIMRSGRKEAQGNTDEVITIFRRWQRTGTAPSLIAMAVAMIDEFDIAQPDNMHLVLMSATLGSLDLELPYHNNLHFRKVALQLMRLIQVHNSIYGETSKALNEDEIAVMLAAACIHDLEHDGKGNTLKGVHEPCRLEIQSYIIAEPFFKECGATQEALDMIKLMLLCTDVSPLGEQTNPMNQMKAAYRSHFMEEQSKIAKLNLSDDLKLLETDPKAALMSCMLQEADIATSGGLSYAVTQYETALYRKEMGFDDARPQHILDFLKDVCQRRFLTDAGQKLFAANMARIYALAEKGVAEGDEDFPKPEYTDFILGKSAANNTSKTLN